MIKFIPLGDMKMNYNIFIMSRIEEMFLCNTEWRIILYTQSIIYKYV